MPSAPAPEVVAPAPEVAAPEVTAQAPITPEKVIEAPAPRQVKLTIRMTPVNFTINRAGAARLEE